MGLGEEITRPPFSKIGIEDERGGRCGDAGEQGKGRGRSVEQAWCCGKKELMKGRKIAVVGTRASTPYGERIAFDFSRRLSELGITVVSGLAEGIDSMAHRGALLGMGSTIAVLGSGIDVVYPRCNRDLYHRISIDGLLLTQFPPGTPPLKGNFPKRNWLIAAISDGVVVVEAGERSGALITADMALDMGKPVLAVPGNVTSAKSRGCNGLIRQGACMATSVEDILGEVYGFFKQASFFSKPDLVTGTASSREAGSPRKADHFFESGGYGPLEKEILSLLASEPMRQEELAARLGQDIRTVVALLVELEVKGVVKRASDSTFFVCLD